MQPKWLALLALLLAIFLLAGCSFRAEDDDGDGGEVEVDDDDDDNDAPGAGLLVMGASLGVAVWVRRRAS